MLQIDLPKPAKSSGILLEEAIKLRRSKRVGYKPKISLIELSRILWSAQGMTSDKKRAIASAGMIYPLELYVVAKSVDELKPGLYRYLPESQSIELVTEGDFQPQVEKPRANEVERKDLGKAIEKACGKYVFVKDAPVCIVVVADLPKITARFGERGIMYVHMEAGSAYQNISLQAVNLGLGTVVVGAFDVKALKESLGIVCEPLCILPVG